MAEHLLWRKLAVLWGVLEVAFFSGIIFGWASLVYVFKKEKYFESSCSSPGITNVSFGGSQVGFDAVNVSSIEYEVEYDLVTPTLQNDSRWIGNEDGVHDIGSLLVSNIYRNSCRKEQDEHFNLIYTLAVCINGVSTFAMGLFYDSFGTRKTRLLGIIMYLSGAILIASTTAGHPFLLYPSMILLSLGGYVILMTNFQLGGLIPSLKSTIVSLYCGAYDTSAFVMVFIKFAFEVGLSTNICFTILTIAFTSVIISTFWYLPKSRIPMPLPEDYCLDFSCRVLRPCRKSKEQSLELESGVKKKLPIVKTSEVVVDEKKTCAANNEEGRKKEDEGRIKERYQNENIPFRQLLCHPLFIWDIVWLSCQRFMSWSYVGWLNPTLERLAHGDKIIVGRYTSIYAGLQFFGILLAPLSGRLMDRKASATPTQTDKISVCVASFIIDNSWGLLLSVLACIPVLEVQYACFVLHVLHRAMLYGPNSAFLLLAFPAQHFGKVFGFVMSISAAFSILQYPLFVMVQTYFDGNLLFPNLLRVLLMVVSLGHPIYITRWCKQQRLKESSETKMEEELVLKT